MPISNQTQLYSNPAPMNGFEGALQGLGAYLAGAAQKKVSASDERSKLLMQLLPTLASRGQIQKTTNPGVVSIPELQGFGVGIGDYQATEKEALESLKLRQETDPVYQFKKSLIESIEGQTKRQSDQISLINALKTANAAPGETPKLLPLPDSTRRYVDLAKSDIFMNTEKYLSPGQTKPPMKAVLADGSFIFSFDDGDTWITQDGKPYEVK